MLCIKNTDSPSYFQSHSRKPTLVSSTHRVDIVKSPVLTVAVNSTTSDWTLDCGAETSLIEKSECERLGLTIHPTRQRAKWGDGKTWVHIVG